MPVINPKDKLLIDQTYLNTYLACRKTCMPLIRSFGQLGFHIFQLGIMLDSRSFHLPPHCDFHIYLLGKSDTQKLVVFAPLISRTAQGDRYGDTR